MSETESSNSSGSTRLLWYCAKCTRMITPPGGEGTVAQDGEHYCAKCAPAKRDTALLAKSPGLSAGSTRPSSRTALPAATAPAASKSNALLAGTKQKRKRFLVMMAAAACVAVALLVGIVLSLKKNGGTAQADAPKNTAAAAPTATIPARAEAAPEGGKEKPAAAKTAASDMPRSGGGRAMGLSFLVSGDQKPEATAETKKAAPAPGASVAPNPAPTNQTPVPDNSLGAFQEELRKADESAKKERYGIALQQLKNLNKRFATAPWWEANKGQAGKAEQLIQQQMADTATEAEDTRLQVRKSEKPQFLDDTETAWKARLAKLSVAGQPDDEQAAQPLRLVLKSVSDRRTQLAEQRKQTVVAKMNPRLEGLERQLKSKEISLDSARKTIEELQAQAAECGALDANLAERLAGLRFDAAVSHDTELAIYKAPIKKVSGGVEIQYDFSTPEQLAAFTLEDAGDASLDTAKGTLVMKHAAGKHNKGDRRVLRLPFDIFQATQWAIEVEATLASNKNKLEYGVFVSDGAGSIVCLGEKQQNAGNIALTLGGQVPGKGLKQRPRLMSGSTKEPAFMQMSCQQGTLGCAGSTATRPWSFDPEKLSFEPRFAGLYIYVHEHDEEASVAFKKLKLRGALNLTKMRQTACAAARKDFDAPPDLFKDWQILGPFKKDHASPWEAKGKLDVSALLRPPSSNPAWQRPFQGGQPGIVDLAALLKPNENVYAYAAAEIQSSREAAGNLLLGSDDGITAWLDGEEIHRFPGPRGVKVDEDKVPLRLSAGAHTLVLRIDQGNGDWGFCARLVGAEGKGPLPGAQLRCAALPK